MNIILFASEELTDSHARITLPRDDPRALHIIDILRRKIGDTSDAGLINGPRGKATLADIAPSDGALTLTFIWEKTPPPPLPPITLIIGLPRPQTARKILNEATALGVSEMHFVTTERGEPSYAQSTLWSSGEYRRHLIAGAAQAFCTRIPRLHFSETLDNCLRDLAREQPAAHRLALDNYESPAPLSERLKTLSSSASPSGPADAPAALAPIILCVGSERGWTAAERDQLRDAQFTFAHLGARVLRTETAVSAAVALALAHLGVM